MRRGEGELTAASLEFNWVAARPPVHARLF